MTLKWRSNDVQMLFKRRSNDVQTTFKCRSNDVQVTFKRRSNVVQLPISLTFMLEGWKRKPILLNPANPAPRSTDASRPHNTVSSATRSDVWPCPTWLGDRSTGNPSTTPDSPGRRSRPRWVDPHRRYPDRTATRWPARSNQPIEDRKFGWSSRHPNPARWSDTRPMYSFVCERWRSCRCATGLRETRTVRSVDEPTWSGLPMAVCRCRDGNLCRVWPARAVRSPGWSRASAVSRPSHPICRSPCSASGSSTGTDCRSRWWISSGWLRMLPCHVVPSFPEVRSLWCARRASDRGWRRPWSPSDRRRRSDLRSTSDQLPCDCLRSVRTFAPVWYNLEK